MSPESTNRDYCLWLRDLQVKHVEYRRRCDDSLWSLAAYRPDVAVLNGSGDRNIISDMCLLSPPTEITVGGLGTLKYHTLNTVNEVMTAYDH